MAEVNDLDTTDASNTARFPEGQAPSTVNNGARALEGLIARWAADFGDGSITTGGSSTAYTVASNRTISAYYDGLTLMVEWHTASGASPTVNVDSNGAKSLVWPNGDAVAADELPANGRALIQYDGTNFQVLTNTRLNATESLLTDLLDSSDYGGDLDDLHGNLSDGGMSVRKLSAGATNAPSGVGSVNASIVVTRRVSSTNGHQLFYEAATTKVYMRTFNTTWGSWTQIDASAAETDSQQLAKGWINFNGTGTVAIRDSFNVSSLTDSGTGAYTVAWDTDFANANYAVSLASRRTPGSGGNQNINNVTVGNVVVETFDASSANLDHDIICITAFGDQ